MKRLGGVWARLFWSRRGADVAAGSGGVAQKSGKSRERRGRIGLVAGVRESQKFGENRNPFSLLENIDRKCQNDGFEFDLIGFMARG